MPESAIHEIVSQKYAKAATTPETCLCGPTNYDKKALSDFIPKEVLDISYGCGTPVGLSTVKPGETVLDIGSGGGIDCFQALQGVGPQGRVYGLDMTDEMLEIARRNAPIVAANLGHAQTRIEFLKGVAEKIPLEDETIDLIISNCVINLSPDKDKVFAEMFRVLRPGGRFTISDIVSDQPVPQYLQVDPAKWGECLSGALLTRDYLAAIDGAGFDFTELTTHSPWRIIDGINFFSVTLTGHKVRVNGEAIVETHVTYPGPFKRARLADGTELNRGQCVAVSPYLSKILLHPGVRNQFVLSHGPLAMDSNHPHWSTSSRGEGTCTWRGDYAVLIGLFEEVEDDDGHIFSRGIPTEICSATDVFFQKNAAVGSWFSRVNRQATDPAEVPESCTVSCC